ncbi:hypothetical protein ACFQ1V_12865 [Virgibacillus natechei]|nr:hypothetical protein [Virgibacillus natechei]
MVTTIALSAILVTGFIFATDNSPTDLASELEPSILSIEQPISFI